MPFQNLSSEHSLQNGCLFRGKTLGGLIVIHKLSEGSLQTNQTFMELLSQPSPTIVLSDMLLSTLMQLHPYRRSQELKCLFNVLCVIQHVGTMRSWAWHIQMKLLHALEFSLYNKVQITHLRLKHLRLFWTSKPLGRPSEQLGPGGVLTVNLSSSGHQISTWRVGQSDHFCKEK